MEIKIGQYYRDRRTLRITRVEHIDRLGPGKIEYIIVESGKKGVCLAGYRDWYAPHYLEDFCELLPAYNSPLWKVLHR
jgi:hypothetical protein